MGVGVEDSEFFGEAREVAVEYLAVLDAEAPVRHLYFESVDAFMFFQPMRGGGSVLVGRDGSFLFADSSVLPSEHEEAFRNGERTSGHQDD